MGNRVANFVCRPSNTPTENGTNVCGQTTAITQTRDCTFNDLLETGSGGYSKGAPGLSVIGYGTATSTNIQWTIIWVNATNQPIQGFGNKVYADMYCHNPDGHNVLETQGLKQ